MKFILRISIIALLFVCLWSANGQTTEALVQGSVTDAKTGEALIAVNVIEQDANGRIQNATISDFNGHYVLKMKDRANVINFTFIGYKSVIKTVGKARIFNVEMSEDIKLLQETVVTAERMHSEGVFSIPQREISTAVQTISTEEFEGVQVTSIDDALQGRIAGLDIVANSGDPGAGTSMRIRGTSSINANQEPLIVLNGIPFKTEIDPNFDFASANEEQFANMLSINPDDILEISVLKDAASTAQWGSSGSNGVLMITTKKGARGKTRVQYSHRFTAAVQPKGLNMLNGDAYTMLMKQAYFNPEQNEYASDLDEYNYDLAFAEYQNFNENTDWVDAVSQIGITNDRYLTVSGGGERARFRVSSGYYSQTGTIIGQELERLSTRAYLDYSVSDRLKFISEFSFSFTDNDRSYSNLLGMAYQKMPNVSIYQQNRQGKNSDVYYNILRESSIEKSQKELSNPVALANLAENNLKNYRILPTFRLQYDLIERSKAMLRYNAYFSFDINNNKTTKYLPQEATNLVWSDKGVNRVESGDSEGLSVQTDNSITWIPTFNNSQHSLTMYGSFQMRTGNSSSQGTNSYGYIDYFDSSVKSYLESIGSSRSSWRSLGMLARAHYAYKSRYIVDATLRRDGVTKFGNGRKFGNFPGISVKWIASDEGFLMGAQKWLSTLAFRPSWGISGNQPSKEYLHFSRYGSSGIYADKFSVLPTSLRLSDLKWEETASYNLGVDIGFFDDKYIFDLNYYKRRTTDLLFKDLALPSSSGQNSYAYQNVGTMDNVGWELNFNAVDVVKSDNFSFGFSLNLSNYYNTIVELRDEVLNSVNGDFAFNNGTYLSRIQEGNAYGSIYGFRYKGVYTNRKFSDGMTFGDAPVAFDKNGKVVLDNMGNPVPMKFAYGTASEYDFKGGDAIYEDVNSDGSIDELDIVYLGNSNPKINGGFGTRLRYRNFGCSMFCNFRYGNMVVNTGRMYAENMYTNDNQSIATKWRWRKDGDLTEMPRALYGAGYNWLGSDRYVEDGSFLRLKYLTFNYSFPMKKLKQFNLNQLNFYLTLNNLLVLTRYTGVDPEVGYDSWGVSTDSNKTPRSKSMTLGVTIVL